MVNDRIELRIEVYNQLVDALKLAYRKHHIGDYTIGREELSSILQDALCEVLSDKGYQAWLKEALHDAICHLLITGVKERNMQKKE